MKELLKEKFLKDLTPSEKIIFLKEARQVIEQRECPNGEDLFYYCYFLTLHERMRKILTLRGDGYVRVLLVEQTKDLEEMIKMYEKRLGKPITMAPDPEAVSFLEYLSYIYGAAKHFIRSTNIIR